MCFYILRKVAQFVSIDKYYGKKRMSLLPRLASSTSKFPESFALDTAEQFGEWFTKTHRLVFHYIYGLHKGPLEIIEDLTAETYLRAWKARHRFRGDENAAIGWLLTIARNLLINSYRRRRFLRLDEDDERQVPSSTSLNPEVLLIRDEQHRMIRHLLQKLPFKQREMLVCRYLLGWRVKEIAQHLNVPENTVSVTIRRGLQRLSDEWPQSER